MAEFFRSGGGTTKWPQRKNSMMVVWQAPASSRRSMGNKNEVLSICAAIN